MLTCFHNDMHTMARRVLRRCASTRAGQPAKTVGDASQSRTTKHTREVLLNTSMKKKTCIMCKPARAKCGWNMQGVVIVTAMRWKDNVHMPSVTGRCLQRPIVLRAVAQACTATPACPGRKAAVWPVRWKCVLCAQQLKSALFNSPRRKFLPNVSNLQCSGDRKLLDN